MYLGEAMDPSELRDVQQQLTELRLRVAFLEGVLEMQGLLRPVPATDALKLATSTVKGDRGEIGSVQPDAAPLLPPPSVPLPALAVEPPVEVPKPKRSLESRIGSQWFNRIGILAVLIAMSWFLKLAIDNHWIGPLGRVVIGLLAGACLIAGSQRFHRQGYPVFAYSLQALGSGILYLSLWAAFSLYHLIPSSVAFAAMIAITAFNGYMSWLRDAEILALYSIVGGLSTPLLLSTGENHEVSLFSYLLLLDAAVLVLTMLRPWSRLLFGAFTGTSFFFLGWWLQFYTAAQGGRTAAFVLCFFLLFALAPRMIRTAPANPKPPVPWDKLATVFMPLANAALAFWALDAILSWQEITWAQPWLAVAFAAFYLLLLKLPARGALTANSSVFSALQLTTAVVFLSLAIPLKTHGRWLTIGWLVEGAALLWVAQRTALPLLRTLAVLCLAFGLGVLFFHNPPASITPLLNERFATYCVAIAVFTFVALLARAASGNESQRQNTIPWATLAPAAGLLMNVLILVAVGWEIHSYWWYVRWHGHWQLLHEYAMYAQFTYSAFFMLFGAILLGIGFWRRSAFVRWQALVLLAAAIGKVFLGDVSSLSQGYRILSFLGLGILLLAVSFAYQRDWLHLRLPEDRNA